MTNATDGAIAKVKNKPNNSFIFIASFHARFPTKQSLDRFRLIH
jgi:hypothetical protein